MLYKYATTFIIHGISACPLTSFPKKHNITIVETKVYKSGKQDTCLIYDKGD